MSGHGGLIGLTFKQCTRKSGAMPKMAKSKIRSG